MVQPPIAYTIDADDVIVSVSDSWNAFAVANDAPELRREHVLGRRLWDFVGDDTTRHMYALLMDRVRRGRPARFPIRCDSPSARRRLEMRVRAETSGDVVFQAFALAVEERDPQRLWDRRVPREGQLRACSWCNRVDVAGTWKEVEEAVSDLRLFESERLPWITHGMCPECVTAFEAALTTS